MRRCEHICAHTHTRMSYTSRAQTHPAQVDWAVPAPGTHMADESTEWGLGKTSAIVSNGGVMKRIPTCVVQFGICHDNQHLPEQLDGVRFVPNTQEACQDHTRTIHNQLEHDDSDDGDVVLMTVHTRQSDQTMFTRDKHRSCTQNEVKVDRLTHSSRKPPSSAKMDQSPSCLRPQICVVSFCYLTTHV